MLIYFTDFNPLVIYSIVYATYRSCFHSTLFTISKISFCIYAGLVSFSLDSPVVNDAVKMMQHITKSYFIPIYHQWMCQTVSYSERSINVFIYQVPFSLSSLS